jgi:tetratricopeptide (TPR) repeat protein
MMKPLTQLWEALFCTTFDDLNESIRLQPAYAEAYNKRRLYYDKTGQYKRAIEDYGEAILLNPDCPGTYHNRALIYLNVGNTRRGYPDAKKACRMGNCELLKTAKNKGSCP